MNKLLQFIADRQPTLNLASLEKEAGIPSKKLSAAMQNHQSLSEKHFWLLAIVLCRFGLELDGYRLEYDQTDGTMLGRRFVETVSMPTEEMYDNPPMLYTVTEERTMFASGIDFVEYLSF